MFFPEIHELLEDPEYKRVQRMIATEIMRGWGMEHDVAHRYVVSASGEPTMRSSWPLYTCSRV